VQLYQWYGESASGSATVGLALYLKSLPGRCPSTTNHPLQ